MAEQIRTAVIDHRNENGWFVYEVRQEGTMTCEDMQKQAEALMCSDLELTEASVGAGEDAQEQSVTERTQACASLIQALAEIGMERAPRLTVAGMSTYLSAQIRITWVADRETVTVAVKKRLMDWLVCRYVDNLRGCFFKAWRPTAAQEAERIAAAASPDRGRRLAVAIAWFTVGVISMVLAYVKLVMGPHDRLSDFIMMTCVLGGFAITFFGTKNSWKAGVSTFPIRQGFAWLLVVYCLLLVGVMGYALWLAIAELDIWRILAAAALLTAVGAITLIVIRRNRKLLAGKYRKYMKH